MTDGIIQQAFKKVSVPLIIEIDDNDVLVIPYQMVENTFKELIEEIKQEIIIWQGTVSERAIEIFIEKLIGDNQE